LVAVSVTWIVAPTALLVGFSALVRPLYQPHYLAFSTPAVALLIGLGVVVVGQNGRRIGAILALLAVAAAPNYLAQRGPYAKYGSDYSQIAGVLAAHSAPGECLSVVGGDSGSPADGVEGARLIHRDGLVDIGTDESARQRNSLFGSWLPVDRRPLADCAVVWVVTAAEARPGTPGFRVQQQWHFNQTVVSKQVRSR
jgi:mannosyltransferase